MILAFVITVSAVLGFLGLFWRTDDAFNALIKTGLIGMSIWGVFVIASLVS